MIPLSADLLNRCHTVLSQCSCFDTTAKLHAVFEPALELAHWRADLPDVAEKGERVRQTVAFLLNHSSREGQPALTIFISVLCMTHVPPEDALYAELDQLRADVEVQTGTVKLVPVPFVIYAMKTAQAEELFGESVFDNEAVAPLARRQFQRLKEALGPARLEQVRASYGERREDWRPPTGAGTTIETLVRSTTDHLNQTYSQAVLLQPEFKSEEFFADDDSTRRQMQDDLGRLGGVIIVDGISLFHPLLWPKLLQAEIASKDNVALLVVSPVNAGEIEINQVIENQINRQLDAVMQRFAAKYDHWCEVGVGDMRGLRRWLVSVLAPEITSPPAPQIHPNNRVWLTSPKRGISRLIGGGGAAR